MPSGRVSLEMLSIASGWNDIATKTVAMLANEIARRFATKPTTIAGAEFEAKCRGETRGMAMCM